MIRPSEKDVYETLCEVGERLDYDHRAMLAEVLLRLSVRVQIDGDYVKDGTIRWLGDGGYLRREGR